MYKQIVIARKDLNMSYGKFAAQVSHGSMAFLSYLIKAHTLRRIKHKYWAWEDPGIRAVPQRYRRKDLDDWAKEARKEEKDYFCAKPVNEEEPYGQLMLCKPEYEYICQMQLENGLYEEWLDDAFTKCVLEAKNKNQLLKAKTIAVNMGMKENEDFFLIYDSCRTELEPEEFDEKGNPRCLTVIGFRPMESKVIDQIGKKFQLYN